MKTKGLYTREYARQQLNEKFQVTIWSDDKIAAFQEALMTWYDASKRELPWRQNKEPYRVWVSEIMLQQTQVDTVIPYYERFLEWFPTLEALANASEDRLLKAWQGLGYYSRVRNMQAAAKQVVADYDGKMPTTFDELLQLKGIGRYTAAAIASISFGAPIPAIDGNAMRVYARLFELDFDIAKPSSRTVFELVGTALIDTVNPGDFNQAIMDLGSSYCRAVNPDPENSPVRDFNQAYQNGTMAKYPIKSKKKAAVKIPYIALAIQNQQGAYLIEKRPSQGLLANLWLFPLVEPDKLVQFKEDQGALIMDLVSESDDWMKAALDQVGLNNVSLHSNQYIGQIQHVFSHQKWQVQLYHCRITNSQLVLDENSSYYWMQESEFDDFAWPTIQMKLWQALIK